MSGYDAPTADDLLGRWPLVREIALLATEAKPEWSVRIGVYGEWGTGKTSVLHQVEALVAEMKHIPVRFNPWGYRDSDAMFGELADSALAALQVRGIEVKGAALRKLRSAGRAITGATEAVGKAAVAVGAPDAVVAAAYAPVSKLSRMLTTRAKDFEDIQAALGDRRLVVFVDDVDRVDPTLLPNLLFALHDVLALSGFSYVLALDPAVVGKALHAHHEGFEDGLGFLEKIIQFPRWLPEPTPEALWELVKRDTTEAFPEIVDALSQERELLPANLRALRSFLRNLWPLRTELLRHDNHEIDLNLLVVLSLLRAASPQLIGALVKDESLLDDISASAVFASKDDEIAKLRQQMEVLVEQQRCREPKHALALLQSMISRTIMWTADRVRYHAYLGERPHAVTWREFGEFWTGLDNDDLARKLDAFISERARRSMQPPYRVANELLQLGLGRHLEALSEASDEFSFEAVAKGASSAQLALHVVEALCFETEPKLNLDAALFAAVRSAFLQWAHFTHERYLELREAERALLCRIVEETPEPDALLEILSPWDFGASSRRPEAGALVDDLQDRLSRRVAKDLALCFETPSGVSGLLREKMHSRRYLLFKIGAAWSDTQKDYVAELSRFPSAVFAANCLEFLRCLMDPSQARDSLASEDVKELARDSVLVTTLWAGVVGVRANPRFVSGIRELRTKLEAVVGELSAPAWLTDPED